MNFMFWGGLLLYSVGQLCSLWMRRGVVSVAIAGIVAVISLAWILITLAGDVPQVIAVGPLVVAGFVGSLTMMGGWLRNDESWPRLFKKAAWIIFAAIVAIGGTLGYRSTQIPVIDPGFDWQAWEERPVASPQWMAEWNRELATANDYATVLSSASVSADELESVGGNIVFGDVFNSFRERPSDEDFKEAREGLLQVSAQLEHMLDEQSLPSPIARPAAVNGVKASYPSVPAATVLRERGDLKDAWHVLRTALRVSIFETHSAPTCEDWTLNALQQQHILAEMRRWANDDQQTANQLNRAIAWFDEHELETIDPADSWRNQYVYFRNLLRNNGDGADRRGGQVVPPVWFLSPLNAAENERMLRLLNIVTRVHLQSQSDEALASGVTPQQIDRWRASALVSNADFRAILARHATIEQGSQYQQQFFGAMQAARHATELVLRLQAFRLREGRFPDQLHDLTGERISTLIHDPLGEHPFGYAPAGMGADSKESRELQLSPEQPCLYSTGSGLVDLGLSYPNQTFADGATLPPIGTENEPITSDPERVRYVILP